MKKSYTEQIKDSFIVEFNNARKQYLAELNQKPFIILKGEVFGYKVYQN